jgi:hypothetical protein
VLELKQAADPSLSRSAAPSSDPIASPPSADDRHGGGVRARAIQRACTTTVAHQAGHSRAATMLCFQVFLDVFQTCCKLMFQVFQLF